MRETSKFGFRTDMTDDRTESGDPSDLKRNISLMNNEDDID